MIIILLNNNNFPETKKHWIYGQQEDNLVPWREGSSLALVGHPSRDGVSMKILVWRHLKPSPQLL